MNVETIKSIINNSIWSSIEKMTIYNFVSDSVISINGQSHLEYSLYEHNDKVELQIGSEGKYIVEYISDFTLRLYNNYESFSIMPD
jgi:hypothetical protein